METSNIENDKPDLQAFKALCEEFKTYIGELKTKWRNENKPPTFRDVYEVLNTDQRK